FMYSAYLGIFVFLPISLRCSSVLPRNYVTTVWSRRSTIWINIILVFSMIASLFIIRWMFLLMLVGRDSKNSDNLIPALFLSYNPILRYYGEESASIYFTHPAAWFDEPSIVVMVASITVFIMLLAGGLRFMKCIVPFCLISGLFWMFQGCTIMLGNMNPDTLGMGFMVSMLTLVYGGIAASIFLIVIISEKNSPPVKTSEPST
ncbi:MAG: hypothetical protein ACRC2T_17570, partial [Thermoguttaceae bacterium]